MHCLIYASRMAPGCDLDTVNEILEVARRRNDEAGISGILFFKLGQFIQYLEGPEEAVRQLFAKISRDPRHEDVRLLTFQKIQQPNFGAWSMAYLPLTRETSGVFRELSLSPEMDLCHLDSETSLELVLELADLVESVY